MIAVAAIMGMTMVIIALAAAMAMTVVMVMGEAHVIQSHLQQRV